MMAAAGSNFWPGVCSETPDKWDLMHSLCLCQHKCNPPFPNLVLHKAQAATASLLPLPQTRDNHNHCIASRSIFTPALRQTQLQLLDLPANVVHRSLHSDIGLSLKTRELQPGCSSMARADVSQAKYTFREPWIHWSYVMTENTSKNWNTV